MHSSTSRRAVLGPFENLSAGILGSHAAICKSQYVGAPRLRGAARVEGPCRRLHAPSLVQSANCLDSCGDAVSLSFTEVQIREHAARGDAKAHTRRARGERDQRTLYFRGQHLSITISLSGRERPAFWPWAPATRGGCGASRAAVRGAGFLADYSRNRSDFPVSVLFFSMLEHVCTAKIGQGCRNTATGDAENAWVPWRHGATDGPRSAKLPSRNVPTGSLLNVHYCNKVLNVLIKSLCLFASV